MKKKREVVRLTANGYAAERTLITLFTAECVVLEADAVLYTQDALDAYSKWRVRQGLSESHLSATGFARLFLNKLPKKLTFRKPRTKPARAVIGARLV